MCGVHQSISANFIYLKATPWIPVLEFPPRHISLHQQSGLFIIPSAPRTCSMAEVIALTASIIAVVQLADRIASVCKSLIETVQDYPRDLRLIFVETGSLKVIFESLRFLNEDDPVDSALLQRLRGADGPVEGCKTAMDRLDRLFPPLPLPSSKHNGAKRQKLQTTFTSLAWPLKAEKARKLLDEIMRHKSTINVALQGQLLWVVHDIRSDSTY